MEEAGKSYVGINFRAWGDLIATVLDNAGNQGVMLPRNVFGKFEQ